MSFGLISEAFSAEEQALITFSGSLPPIRATYSDIDVFVSDLEDLLKRAPADEKKPTVVCPVSYQVDRGKDSLTTRSLKSLLKQRDLPNPATGFRITCLSFERDNPVSSVTIQFGDMFSSYDLRGSDQVLLFALRARLQSFTERYRIWLGGSTFQFGVFMIIMLVASICLTERLTVPGRNKPIVLLPLGLVFSITGIILLTGGYLGSWFPQTAIYRDSASFIERNAALIGFWGFVASITTPIISAIARQIISFIKSKPQPPADQEHT